MGQHELDTLAVNTIRFLAADPMPRANSGQPGRPMGGEPAGRALWTRHLKRARSSTRWPDRDRFVLSAGRGSMLVSALLPLAGFDLSLGDLRQCRQWESRTPGHPEYGVTAGV